MTVLMGRGLPHRAHFVQINLKTATSQLQSRFAACKAATNYTYAFVH